MAKKKQASASARQGKRSKGHIGLGVKKFGGQVVAAGNIVVRQRGSTFYPGINALSGRDFSIFATSDGIVNYRTKQGRTYIDILNPQDPQNPQDTSPTI